MASSTPYHLPLSSALDRNDMLASLLERLRDSQARLEAITPLLPPALRAAVRSGPVDEAAWVLLAANAAAAAKLRQLQPDLQAALAASGWAAPTIKIKVASSA